MDSALHMLSAVEISARVRGGELSASDVAAAACTRVAALEPTLHAMLHFDADQVMARAKLVDQTPGLRAGSLAGVPIVVKDNLQVAGMPLTCASKILGKYVSPYTATCVERLLDAGAVILGKSNLDEFAMGSSCEHSAFGPTKNPWDVSRVPGGSSGGSAAAVAAGYAPLALGSDTGGSIRQPAALCGTVGVKPTYGTVSRYGLVAFASSLDQVGPFARSVDDAELCLSVMAGADKYDSTCGGDRWATPSAGAAGASLKGLRVGVVRSHFGKGIESEVSASVHGALEELEAAGAQRVEIEMPMSEYGVQIYYIIATSEASANLSRFDGVRYGLRMEGGGLADLYGRSRGVGFGPEVKRRIMLGTYALSAGYQDAYYRRALAGLAAMREEYRRCFERCDVILGPTSPQVAFPLGQNLGDPLAMYLCDLYTIGANLAGVPALSIPGQSAMGGLPVGVQLQGPHGSDRVLLGIARAVEQLLGIRDRVAEPKSASGASR